MGSVALAVLLLFGVVFVLLGEVGEGVVDSGDGKVQDSDQVGWG